MANNIFKKNNFCCTIHYYDNNEIVGYLYENIHKCKAELEDFANDYMNSLIDDEGYDEGQVTSEWVNDNMVFVYISEMVVVEYRIVTIYE